MFKLLTATASLTAGVVVSAEQGVLQPGDSGVESAFLETRARVQATASPAAQPQLESWYMPPLKHHEDGGALPGFPQPPAMPSGGAGFNPFIGNAAAAYQYNRGASGYPYYPAGYPSAPVAAVPGVTAGYSNVYSLYPSAFYRFREEGLEQQDAEEGEGERADSGAFLHGHTAGARFADVGLRDNSELESEAAAFAARHGNGLKNRHWSEFTERAAIERQGAEAEAQADAEAQAEAMQQQQQQQAAAIAIAQQRHHAMMMRQMAEQAATASARQSAYTPAQRAHRLREMQAELQEKVALLKEKLAQRKRNQQQQEQQQEEQQEQEHEAEADAEAETETETEAEAPAASAQQQEDSIAAEDAGSSNNVAEKAEEAAAAGEKAEEKEQENQQQAVAAATASTSRKSSFRRPVMVDNLSSSSSSSGKKEE